MICIGISVMVYLNYRYDHTYYRTNAISVSFRGLKIPMKVTDQEIDVFLEEYKKLAKPLNLNDEQLAQLQALTVLYMHESDLTAANVWDKYGSSLENELESNILLKHHEDDFSRLYSYFTHRNAILKYKRKDNRIIECEYENVFTRLYETLNSQIWEKYRTIGGGNKFYRVNGKYYWQCTTFAYARFYEVYGYFSGASGNGCLHAQEIVKAHPTWFRITYYPTPGATFSVAGSDKSHWGHVGFVEACDNQYIWVSEGNVGVRGGIRFNYKMTIQEFFKKYPNVIFASPINYFE